MESLRTVFILIALLCVSGAALAAEGKISGKVTSEAGEAIAFANITVEGTNRGAAANVNGEYLVQNVPVGSYKIKASAVGYRSQTSSVPVTADQTTTSNFTLAEDVLRMGEVVVTGTYTPRPKLESTVAISTLTPRDLTLSNPRSTTEVLRYIPGFTRVESSGGEVNQNISVRGILGVEYVMFMEDGMPVFPTMHLYFMNADNLFRTDENIQTVEVVRGGNSALFGSNTPGAIINYINKTGGPEFGGAVKATGGTEGLARYDFNINGPISEDMRFSLGGFYRYDRGVRYPGFPGIRGGQIKANVMKLLNNGYIKASLKLIDDRNQFILPLPFQDPDNPEYVPGFSDYGAMNTAEANNVVVTTPTGDLQFPLEDGLRTQAYWLTADISFDFQDGWTLKNTAQFMDNNQGWNGIFTGQPTNADSFVVGLNLPAGSTYRLFYTNQLDVNGKRLPFDRNANNGLALLSPSTLVTVKKPMSAFQDQVQIVKTIDNKHTVSLGLYFANYTLTNRWYFADILMDVRDNPRLVDLEVYTATDTLEYTKNGFRRFVSLYRNGTGSTTIFSGMLGGTFQITDKLRGDLGFRYESDDYVQSAENQSNFDIDGNDTTTYDNEQWGNKSFRHFSRTIDDYAISGGLNYSLTDEIALYAQGSRAFKMPALDDIFDGQAQDKIDLFESREVVMIEGGVKYSAPTFAFTVNGFWGRLSNIVSQGFEKGAWVVKFDPDNRTYGAEIEASAAPTPGLRILAAGTYTKAENVAATGSAITAGGIPSFIGNAVVSYTYQGFSPYLDFHYVGVRKLVDAPYDKDLGKYLYVNEFMELGAYTYMNLGASYTFPGEALRLSLDLLNVYQSKGLEEGNPRLPGVKTFYFVARPILPRRLMASLSYQF